MKKKHEFKPGDLVRRRRATLRSSGIFSNPDSPGVIVKAHPDSKFKLWHVVWSHGIDEIIMDHQLSKIEETK